MTILHPALLALLVLPLGYAAYEWRRTTRKTALILKIASLAATIAALSEPVVTLPETKTGVVVLVDTSNSISNGDLQREASVVSTMAGSVGRNWMRVIPFARRVREVGPDEVRGGWTFRRTASGDGEATDFESAVREGIS